MGGALPGKTVSSGEASGIKRHACPAVLRYAENETKPRADTCEMSCFHASKSRKMPFELPIYTRCHIKTIVQDSGRSHKIVHAGVAFTQPHAHSPEWHFRRNPMACGKFRFIWLTTPRGLTSK